MRCPYCRSENVRRSQSRDSSLYRIVLLARMRCHCCLATFFVRSWQEVRAPQTAASDGENPDATAA